ncbi:capsular polysaccharide biosynthesis protein [Campylobacter gastrosuis]|uniref:Capsular polysaccharide biosynthesis protein n=1 Tax=Campylobacter gastrosuis TaxID=2974576 RepID=A0ABT7HT55_9BACT|nr:capsular polysaccharide biosynthesis protein [Campylobacter gastrosuis]MDL0089942.1 capsular polysaccharide biosynthesis protein [Campylobacter gastrosuis]
MAKIENFSTSKRLIKNAKNFFDIKPVGIFKNLKNATFYGWGYKKSGLNAINLAKKHNGSFTLLEDGFIRSLGLSDTPSFSIVSDDIGIYYNAQIPSKLENLLNSYEFDENLLNTAKKAINLIKTHNISKYNHAKPCPDNLFKSDKKNVLIIAQTKNDASLTFGLADNFSTTQMIDDAVKENPNANIYLKIHPDVINGLKESDINLDQIPKNVKILQDDFNPISLLKHFIKVYTKTSQMGFEALILGLECVCYGMPFYAGWGVSIDKIKCARRKKQRSIEEIFAAAYILYTTYKNPYNGKNLDIIQTINEIIALKEKEAKTAYLFGFSRWKHEFVRPFLSEFQNLIFINPLISSHAKLAIKKGLNHHNQIFIWGAKNFKRLEKFYKITRVEDGFIRSKALGSDLTRPYSLVFDDLGIYFNPSKESRLERILNTHEFNDELLKQARELRQILKENKISKYNHIAPKELNFKTNKKKILVVGQVEDDMSVKLGANGKSNLELLKMVKDENKDAFIIYKPHPDVESGNRVGKVADEVALKFCDTILKNANITSILPHIDELCTLSSLTGFEALLYGKKVVCYGMPFYAGWGLSTDKITCNRRVKRPSIDELIAAVYILYPRYLSPKTLEICTPKQLIDELKDLKVERLSALATLKRCFFRIFK